MADGGWRGRGGTTCVSFRMKLCRMRMRDEGKIVFLTGLGPIPVYWRGCMPKIVV
jgi:hypothetical protein